MLLSIESRHQRGTPARLLNPAGHRKKIEKDTLLLYLQEKIQKLCFLFDNFPAVIMTTALANPVGCLIFAAVWAFHQCGSRNFPNVGTSFIPSCFGCLSLWYCHNQHLLALYYAEYVIVF